MISSKILFLTVSLVATAAVIVSASPSGPYYSGEDQFPPGYDPHDFDAGNRRPYNTRPGSFNYDEELNHGHGFDGNRAGSDYLRKDLIESGYNPEHKSGSQSSSSSGSRNTPHGQESYSSSSSSSGTNGWL